MFNGGYSRFTGIFFLIILTVGLCSCSSPEPAGFVIGNAPVFEKPVPMNYDIAGYSVKGRPIDYYEFGSGSDAVFLLAGIHGNEPAGIPIAQRLITYLQENTAILDDRKIIIMPIANPDGFISDQRYNANGVDLNRNFEAANRINNKTNGPKGLSEPESRAIKKIIKKYNPNRIISLHEPLDCIDYDGPGKSISWRMGLYCDLEVKKLGSRPGSLGSYAGNTLGIPIITVEFTPTDKNLSDEQLWNKYGKMTLAAVMYPETIRSDMLAK